MASGDSRRADGVVFLGGMAAADLTGDLAAQTRGVLERADAALKKTGSSLDRALSVTVFLDDASQFQAMNDAYRSFWPADYPARTTVVATLPTPGARVEMSFIAVPAGGERRVLHPPHWIPSPSPYSYAVRSGDTVFLSGLVARNGRDNSIVKGDAGAQTRAILDNAGELLEAAGLSHSHVAVSRVYLPDVASFGAMNDAYRAYFPASPPARATVQATLAGPQYSVEITLVASTAPRTVINEGLPPNLNLPLSAAIVAGQRAYLSGALGYDENNTDDPAAQTRATLEKLRRTLAAAGAAPADVVEATVYVTDLAHLPEVDREYRAFFGAHAPARTVVRAGLVAPQGLVEIMFTAALPPR